MVYAGEGRAAGEGGNVTIYFAHSVEGRGEEHWQTLAGHLAGTAALARTFGEPLGIGTVAAAAGLLHDLGKYTPAFRNRLDGGPSVDHSTAGAVEALRAFSLDQPGMADLVAYAILGHHAGLPDRENETAACFDRRIDEFDSPPDPVWSAELDLGVGPLAPEGFRWSSGSRRAFQLSVLGRMVFSCLVDADRKDTEHFAALAEGAPLPDRDWPNLGDVLPDLRRRFDEHMSGKPVDGDVNALRRRVLAHVRGRAGEAPGAFTLTVPTGGGKTLASLGFALDHAAAHGHRRIIYAIPFTSIIDQTAEIFRHVLGEEVVLEHHSAIEEDKAPDSRGPASQRGKLRLAMEDWAAPVVVTTSVQLFESLFAARPARARKLHNIARSVIILDEAQTLPRELLLPVMRMLEELCSNYGCTVVLCTATQPALGRREGFDGLDLAGRELAPDPVALSDRLRRATIRQVGPLADGALVEALAGERQALVIVSSRRHALDLYRAAERAGLDGLVHLSTRQCAAHRQAILAGVKQRLKDKLPCRVVATSLVEAGVDIDFPRVWRAEAGLDQIVQAAGRCNREGKGRAEDSIVTVFEAPDHPSPPGIRSLVDAARRALGAGGDHLALDTIETYFREVYWKLGDNLDKKIPIAGSSQATHRILGCFSHTTRCPARFAYRSVAEGFRMIESGMEPVIVPFDDEARKELDRLRIERISSGELARKLQRYVVQVPPKARALLIANGHVVFAEPELRGDQFAVLIADNLYLSESGLIWEDADYLAIGQSIIDW